MLAVLWGWSRPPVNQGDGMSVEKMVFNDLAPVEVEVEIERDQYVLREPSEGAAVKYRNAALRAARMVDGKVTGMDGLADAEPLLVSLCLFKTNGNGARVPVSLDFVMSLKPKVVRALYERVKQIGGMDDEGDPKKSPANSTPSSGSATS